MSRRLKTIAAEIQTLRPQWRITLDRNGFASTDRKIAGTRLRHPGKGRWGTELFVYDEHGHLVFRHNAAEPYRSNDEVERWVDELKSA